MIAIIKRIQELQMQICITVVKTNSVEIKYLIAKLWRLEMSTSVGQLRLTSLRTKLEQQG